MNKSKEENNQDIKPVRSEAVSNRGQRRVKGGSWKDIGAFLQIGARDFEYQDSSRCYVGFRCVKSRPYQEGQGQFEEIFQGVKDKKQKKKKKKKQ